MSPSASGRARPARKEGYHHGDLRRAMLDATLDLCSRFGPQGFSLRAAARAAGVTPAATYHHFKDKDALIAGVAEEGFHLLRADLDAAARRPAPSLRNRSHNVGVAYVLFAMKHPTRFRVMVGYGVQRSKRADPAPEAKAAYLLVRQVLIEGLRTKPDEAVSEAEVFGWWSVVHGLAFLAIDGHLGQVGASPERAERFVHEVIAALDARSRGGAEAARR